ncbi:MAG: hypothetical protein JWQ62_3162 [Lacunisphaera sp.]|nr:hypothetical protein [Lacunisphaera sp.]
MVPTQGRIGHEKHKDAWANETPKASIGARNSSVGPPKSFLCFLWPTSVSRDGNCACVEGGTRRFVRSPEVLSTHSEDPGKAVQTGHSCAAVTHHRPPARRQARAQSQFPTPVGGEGEGRGAATKVAAHMRSPNICLQNSPRRRARARAGEKPSTHIEGWEWMRDRM